MTTTTLSDLQSATVFVPYAMSRTVKAIYIKVSPLTALFKEMKDGAYLAYHKQPKVLPMPHLRMVSHDALRYTSPEYKEKWEKVRPTLPYPDSDGFAKFRFRLDPPELAAVELFNMTLADYPATKSSLGVWQLAIPLTENPHDC